MADYKKNSFSSTAKENFGIYFAGTALLIMLVAVFGILIVVFYNGLGIFWQKPLFQWQLKSGEVLLGTINRTSSVDDKQIAIQIKTANRDIVGYDYQWLSTADIKQKDLPADAVLIERIENGDFFGYFDGNQNNLAANLLDFETKLIKVKQHEVALGELLEKISLLNQQIFDNDSQIRSLSQQGSELTSPDLRRLTEKTENLKSNVDELFNERALLIEQKDSLTIALKTSSGENIDLAVGKIVHLVLPNQMNVWDKILGYLRKLWILLSTEPREANTEGGIFPAIFGTVVMVFLMSILSFPLGVITAIYLQEYAKSGWLLKVVRIAVSNLAGVPSIVYGIFGLGFFVYGVGGFIDNTFFSEFLPTPTFGTGGILWASLTLGLLTAPVVIVSTEEALAAIPRGTREASYALGANKLQTVLKVVLPLASPGMLTGFILAMARAAGEVAPLMITGVVKLAPSLPIDGEFPFVHLNRKFMHLGFHIFDLGFQSPNVEASKPMVYMTTLLLILIVILMAGTAIYIRSKMIAKYSISSI